MCNNLRMLKLKHLGSFKVLYNILSLIMQNGNCQRLDKQGVKCLCGKNLCKAGAQQEVANTKMRFVTVKTHEIGLSLRLYIAYYVSIIPT